MAALYLIDVLVMQWQVNQKMILTLTASIMYWSLQQSVEDSDSSPSPALSVNSEDESSLGGEVSNLTIDDAASDTTVSSQFENEDPIVACSISTASNIANEDTPVASNNTTEDTPVASGNTTEENPVVTPDAGVPPPTENEDSPMKE